jgi:uncharacterized protein
MNVRSMKVHKFPYNIILGQANFVFSVDMLKNRLMEVIPNKKFAIGYTEASETKTVCLEGNDEELKQFIGKILIEFGAGHIFLIICEEYPIKILNHIRTMPTLVNIFCATGNSIEVFLIDGELGSAILGVCDGYAPKKIESIEDKAKRKKMCKELGYDEKN